MAYHLPLVPLSRLALVDGLAGIETALGLGGEDRVRIALRAPFLARFDNGTTAQQLLHASQSLGGSPWYDTVLHHLTADNSAVPVGEVRAIVRLLGGDVAVLADMEAVAAVPHCPLVARGCTWFAWHVPRGQQDVCLRVVPLQSIRRVVHVVPAFQDLMKCCGLQAEPAAMSAPWEERLAMRCFLNDFHVWS